MKRYRYWITWTGELEADNDDDARDAAYDATRWTPADDCELEEVEEK